MHLMPNSEIPYENKYNVDQILSKAIQDSQSQATIDTYQKMVDLNKMNDLILFQQDDNNNSQNKIEFQNEIIMNNSNNNASLDNIQIIKAPTVQSGKLGNNEPVNINSQPNQNANFNE